MTRERLLMAETITMRDAQRMADELRAQSHDEGNARITEDIARERDPLRMRSDAEHSRG
jgi:hypothetical protein